MFEKTKRILSACGSLAIRPALFAAAACLVLACALASDAFPGTSAYAESTHPTAPPATTEEYAPSAVDRGMEEAIDGICNFSVEEGRSLLEAQAQMVADAFPQTGREAASKAQAQVSPEAEAPTVTAPAFDVIYVAGEPIPFVDTYKAAEAPPSGAGLWMGSDSTTDGSWGYFIGHNPGSFHNVMNLSAGSAIAVTDDAGATRTYHVVDAFIVPDTTTWEDIETRVTGYGESIILQTCCGDHANYRVVVAV